VAPNRAGSPWLQVHDSLLARFGPQDWWPGETPFEVMVGAVLTQNTAWTNVERAIANLRGAQALSCSAILALDPAHLSQLIRPAGFFNVKARRLLALCRFLREESVELAVEQLAHRAPLHELRQRLLGVHGVGDETADSILLYALNLPSFVVDAYTRRIFARLGLLAGDEAYAEIQQAFQRNLPETTALYNEFHALIVALGKTFCRPKPRCDGCPLVEFCTYAANSKN